MTVKQEQTRKQKQARLEEITALVKANPTNLPLHQKLFKELQHITHPGLTLEEANLKKRKYGNVEWTEQALQMVKEHSPIVEVGAGTSYNK